MPLPVIEDLVYDEALEEKLIKKHGVWVDDIYDMILDQNEWILLRNKKEHPPEHQVFVGPCSNGRLLTVILRPTNNPGFWRIISAWKSDKHEISGYRKARPHRHA